MSSAPVFRAFQPSEAMLLAYQGKAAGVGYGAPGGGFALASSPGALPPAYSEDPTQFRPYGVLDGRTFRSGGPQQTGSFRVAAAPPWDPTAEELPGGGDPYHPGFQSSWGQQDAGIFGGAARGSNSHAAQLPAGEDPNCAGRMVPWKSRKKESAAAKARREKEQALELQAAEKAEEETGPPRVIHKGVDLTTVMTKPAKELTKQDISSWLHESKGGTQPPPKERNRSLCGQQSPFSGGAADDEPQQPGFPPMMGGGQSAERRQVKKMQQMSRAYTQISQNGPVGPPAALVAGGVHGGGVGESSSKGVAAGVGGPVFASAARGNRRGERPREEELSPVLRRTGRNLTGEKVPPSQSLGFGSSQQGRLPQPDSSKVPARSSSAARTGALGPGLPPAAMAGLGLPTATQWYSDGAGAGGGYYYAAASKAAAGEPSCWSGSTTGAAGYGGGARGGASSLPPPSLRHHPKGGSQFLTAGSGGPFLLPASARTLSPSTERLGGGLGYGAATPTPGTSRSLGSSVMRAAGSSSVRAMHAGGGLATSRSSPGLTSNFCRGGVGSGSVRSAKSGRGSPTMWATVSGTGSAPALLPPPPEEAQEDAAREPPAPRPVPGGISPVKPKPVPAALRVPAGAGRRPSLKDPVPQFAGAAAPAALAAADARKAAEEEFEKQKLRLACKMEIVNFYGGCCAEFGKMTAAQNKELQKRIRSSDADAQDKVVGQFCDEREDRIKSWSKKADDPKGVQRRLAKLSEFCGGSQGAQGSRAVAQAASAEGEEHVVA